MTLPYTRFSYIRPPRTDSELTSRYLPRYESEGWWAQFKRNGTNSSVYVNPDREVEDWNRHNERQKLFRFDDETSAIYRTLAGRKWFVFNGELMHSKVRGGPRRTHYLFDVLVYEGEYLMGTTYAERYELLHGLFPKTGLTPAHFVLDDYTWLARNHTKGLLPLFNSLDAAMDEGLMLKRPDARLMGWKADGWMVKVKK